MSRISKSTKTESRFVVAYIGGNMNFMVCKLYLNKVS